jgi:hypothetical protein
MKNVTRQLGPRRDILVALTSEAGFVVDPGPARCRSQWRQSNQAATLVWSRLIG